MLSCGIYSLAAFSYEIAVWPQNPFVISSLLMGLFLIGPPFFVWYFGRERVYNVPCQRTRPAREEGRHRSTDEQLRRARSRELADMDGFIEPRLWTGVGRARSGCGAALVGSADQILSEIEAYQKMGMRSFIFSGYPHLEECDYIGKLVLPELKTCSLPHEYGRVPAATPATPLGVGDRH